MKILIVAGPFISLREPYSGGTEAFIVAYANELVRLGHTVDVLAKDTDEKNLFQVIELPESPLSMRDESYRACPEWRGQQYFQTFQFGLINVANYDMIHYNSFIPEIYAVGALLKKPSVLTLHLPPTEKFALMYKFFVKHAEVLPVGISERMAKAWEPVLDKNVEVVLNGIPLENWNASRRQADGYLLWSGRITPEKNVEAAIHLAKYLNLPLKIVGSVFNENYFNEKVAPHLGGGIEYISQVSQSKLSALAAGASAFLATAVWDEPFGLSTLEMLASGLPVVGFETAIPPELRKENICVAVNSDNWQDLIAPLENVKKSSPEACRAFAESFSINKMTQNYIEIFRRLTVKSE